MKKNKMLTTLMVLLMTVGCGVNNSSTSTSSSTTKTSSSNSTSSSSSITSSSSSTTSSSSSTTSSSSSTTSSSPDSTSSSETVIESKIVLDEIQKGFATKSTYVKQYNKNTPTNTCVTSFISDGVAQWEHYSSSNWDNIVEVTRPYKFAQ